MKIVLNLLLILIVVVPITDAQTLSMTSNRENSKVVLLNLAMSPDNFRYSRSLDHSLYKEISVDLQIGKFTTLGLYVGYQNRPSEFLSTHPFDPAGGTKKINYERNYFPIGIRGALHITDFFKDNMGLIQNKEKWDVYLMAMGGATLSNERFITNIEGEIIEYSNYEGEDDVQYILGFLTGIRYYPIKNFGVFVEGGVGPMGRVNFGLTKRFKK